MIFLSVVDLFCCWLSLFWSCLIFRLFLSFWVCRFLISSWFFWMLFIEWFLFCNISSSFFMFLFRVVSVCFWILIRSFILLIVFRKMSIFFDCLFFFRWRILIFCWDIREFVWIFFLRLIWFFRFCIIEDCFWVCLGKKYLKFNMVKYG